MKADLDLIKIIMQRNDIPARTVSRVIEDVRTELGNQFLDEEKPPTVKKQFVVLTTGEVGWVLQIPEDDSPALVRDRVVLAAQDYNASPKGRRLPVQTIGETIEIVPARFFKEAGAWVKTKVPVLIQQTVNKL